MNNTSSSQQRKDLLHAIGHMFLDKYQMAHTWAKIWESLVNLKKEEYKITWKFYRWAWKHSETTSHVWTTTNAPVEDRSNHEKTSNCESVQVILLGYKSEGGSYFPNQKIKRPKVSHVAFTKLYFWQLLDLVQGSSWFMQIYRTC